MAQTKKKRKRKHRGTPAGTIEARGRTGRPQVKKDARAIARERREERANKEPTWRASLNRAVVAALLFVAAVILIFGQDVASAFGLGAVMVLVYWPMTYYLDTFLWRRRMRGRAARGEGS